MRPPARSSPHDRLSQDLSCVCCSGIRGQRCPASWQECVTLPQVWHTESSLPPQRQPCSREEAVSPNPSHLKGGRKGMVVGRRNHVRDRRATRPASTGSLPCSRGLGRGAAELHHTARPRSARHTVEFGSLVPRANELCMHSSRRRLQRVRDALRFPPPPSLSATLMELWLRSRSLVVAWA